MIKNIVFDLGNVVVCFDHDVVISPFTNNQTEIDFLKTSVIGCDEWHKIDVGAITEKQMFESYKKRMSDEQFKLAADFSHNWYRKGNPLNIGAVKIAHQLKKMGYRLYVLSNISIECFEYIKKENPEFFALFDGLIISGYEKVKKPDPKIFEILLKRFKLNANETLLIDDDDTGHTFKTANSMGILGHAVKKNDEQSIIALLKQNEIKI